MKARTTVALTLFGMLSFPVLAGADIVKSGAGGSITDNDPAGVNFSLDVTEDETVEGVQLQLNGFDHTWVGDLIITLTGPDGSVATVINRTGSQFLNDDSNLTSLDSNGGESAYIFDDDASGDWWGEATIGDTNYNMRPAAYQPSDANGVYASMSAQFANKSSQGTWTLNVSDNLGGDTGGFESWNLTLFTQSSAVPEPGPGLLLAGGLGLTIFGGRRRRRL